MLLRNLAFAACSLECCFTLTRVHSWLVATSTGMNHIQLVVPAAGMLIVHPIPRIPGSPVALFHVSASAAAAAMLPTLLLHHYCCCCCISAATMQLLSFQPVHCIAVTVIAAAAAASDQYICYVTHCFCLQLLA